MCQGPLRHRTGHDHMCSPGSSCQAQPGLTTQKERLRLVFSGEFIRHLTAPAFAPPCRLQEHSPPKGDCGSVQALMLVFDIHFSAEEERRLAAEAAQGGAGLSSSSPQAALLWCREGRQQPWVEHRQSSTAPMLHPRCECTTPTQEGVQEPQ